MDVQRLGLADKRPTVRGLVNDHLLFDLPHRLVQIFQTLRDFSNVLDGATISDDLIAHLDSNKIEVRLRLD